MIRSDFSLSNYFGKSFNMGSYIVDSKIWKHKLALLFFLLSCVKNVAADGRKDASELPEAPLAGPCRIIINEISLQDLDKQFIELKKICKDQPKMPKEIKMEKYAIVFVDTNNYIIGVCLLKGKLSINDRWFYTIGTDSLTNINFKISECEMPTEANYKGKARFPGEMLKISTFGILLVRKETVTSFKDYNLLKMGFNKGQKKISNRLKSSLVTGLQDYYIMTSSKSGTITKDLQSMYTQYTAHDQLEINTNVHKKTNSLSRCVPSSESDLPKSYLPMQPTYFQISTPTLGAENTCSESTVQQLNAPEIVHKGDSSSSASASEDAGSSESQQSNLVITHVQSPEQVQANNPTTTSRIADFRFNEKPMNKFQTDFEGDPSMFWEDCSDFPADQSVAMQELAYKPINVQKILTPPTCTWIEYLIPKKLVICKLCRTLLEQKIIFERPGLLTTIMKDGAGIFNVDSANRGRTASTANHKQIEEHEHSTLHQLSVEFKNLFKSGLRDKALIDAFQGPGTTLWNRLLPTMNMIVSVIQGIKLGLSFNVYSILTETLEYFNADIGHLYQTDSGMKVVADSIGLKLHKDIVERWLREKPELSITLDTTTDISGYGILAIFFHTVEKSGDLKIYMYRMMHIPEGESGMALFSQFKKSLQNDKIDDWVKEKCVALTTDGAPSVKNVFRRELNGFTDNPILGNWCGAHRLERAAEKAFTEHEYLREIDGFINAVYRILSTKSPLRKEEFRQQIEHFNVPKFEVHRVRELRWLPFHVRALEPYITRFNVLHATLHSIITNPKVQLQTRQEVEVLLNRLSDATFLATLAFTADVLNVIAEVSTEYQRHAGTLIGKKQFRKQTEDKLIALQTTSGYYIEYLLDRSFILERRDVHRAEAPESLKDRIEKFETSTVKYLEVKLKSPNSLYENNRVYIKMQDYVDSLLTQLDAYYPNDLADNYDVFTPSLLPKSLEQIGDYGKSELQQLNQGFKWGMDDNVLLLEWKTLLSSLAVQPTFSSMQSKYPEVFWEFYLKSDQVSWNPNIRLVVSKALTIPSSSAACERSFSIYRFIKSYRRYSLLPATVENLIRIKVNGPAKLKDWNIFEFAKAFILDSHSRADDNTRNKKIKRVCQQESLVAAAPINSVTCPANEEDLPENDLWFPLIDRE